MQDAVSNLFHKICLLHHFKTGIKLAFLHALLLLFLKFGFHKAQKKLCGEAWLWGVLFETFIDEAAEKVEIVLLETKAKAESALVTVESCWSWSTELDKHFSKENISLLTLRMLSLNVVDLRESVKRDQEKEVTWQKTHIPLMRNSLNLFLSWSHKSWHPHITSPNLEESWNLLIREFF